MTNPTATKWGAFLSAARRRPLYVLVAVALAAIALWSFWPRALPVEAAQVARGPLTVSFTEEGRTRLQERYQLSAPLDGVVGRIAFEPGDGVQAGATVATLRPLRSAMFDPANRAQSEARLRAAESELDSADAAVLSARAEHTRSAAALRRGQALAADRLIAREQLDALRTQHLAAAAALRSAQARARTVAVLRDGYRAALELQGAPSEGNSLPLRAPVDGRIVRRFVESETPVRMGQPLLEIGDPQALEVVAEVLTADAVRLRRGGKVRLLRWGGPEPLPGHVRTIEPGGFTKVSALGVEEQRTLVVVALDAPPDQRPALGDGFRVEAEFQVWQAGSVLQVPTAALFRDGPDWAAYAVEGGHARLRRLRLGHIGDDAAELRGGLREGTQVVLYPGDSIRDGQRVAANTR